MTTRLPHRIRPVFGNWTGAHHSVRGVLNRALLWGLAGTGLTGWLHTAQAQALPSVRVRVVHAFNRNVDGQSPFDALVQDKKGLLYGVTADGGGRGKRGTVYRFDPRNGKFSVLHAFSGGANDGTLPASGLLVGDNGLLYGTTRDGSGSNGNGTIFQLDPKTGRYTVLHIFTTGISNGYTPSSALVMGADRNLYGVTLDGNVYNNAFAPQRGEGTVYRLSPRDGAYAVIHAFRATQDGDFPKSSLFLGRDRALYGVIESGTTPAGGAGFIYRIAPTTNAYTRAYVFHDTPYGADGQAAGPLDGATPYSPPVQGPDGNLYGTTARGGLRGQYFGRGTVYRVTPQGTDFTVLHPFLGAKQGDGSNPLTSPVVGSDGSLYGTTSVGGGQGQSVDGGSGIIYRLAPDGSGYVVLHAFAGGANDGDRPTSGLLVGRDGKYYGVTGHGGIGPGGGDGVLYRLVVR